MFARLCVIAILLVVVLLIKLTEFNRDREASLHLQRKMKSQGSYVPPRYIPLGQSEYESEVVLQGGGDQEVSVPRGGNEGPKQQWSSGICTCCDDMQSCCIGLLCPCYLFGKNAEVLGSGTLIGSCLTHSIFWTFLNAACCLMTDKILLGLPRCFFCMLCLWLPQGTAGKV